MPRPKKHPGLHDRQKIYHQSDKGKQAIQKYESSDAAKERKRKWWTEHRAQTPHKRTQQFLNDYGDPGTAIAALTEREQFVLTRYFGLDDQPPQTFDAIAQQLELSKEAVRQIKLKALKKLTPLENPDNPSL